MNKIKFTTQELSDQWFIMETAMLECAIQEKLDSSDISIYTTQVGVYYIVSNKLYKNNKPEKVWFKKDFR